MQPGRVVLFVNGEMPNIPAMRTVIRPDDLIVAVDGGLQHVLSLGLEPHWIIGDMDSAAADELQHWQAKGVRIDRYPVEKDETDLELALQSVMQDGYHTVLIAAATGGRLDHTLGNLYLLSAPYLQDFDVRLDDGLAEIFLIRDEADINGAAGDIVSLLPLEAAVEGVLTTNLQFPLRWETLYPEKTRGISNVMLGEHARVEIAHGTLLCIHYRNQYIE
jgi:thiamine pyrophosphokinase